jgi:hypothetical protein
MGFPHLTDCRQSNFQTAERFGKQIFITLLRKVGFADRPILGDDYFPNGIRRRNSLPPRKIYAWRRERHRRRRLAEGKCFDRGFKAFMLMEPFVCSSVLARRNPDFDEGCRLCRHPKRWDFPILNIFFAYFFKQSFPFIQPRLFQNQIKQSLKYNTYLTPVIYSGSLQIIARNVKVFY